MRDRFGRKIDYIRLSVTDRCNFSCVYCGDCDECHISSGYEMNREEILRIIRAARYLGIRKVRLTGGEPLMRPDILNICRDISSLSRIDEVCITTNGSMLRQYAADLRAAGVSRINISLDTIDRDMFRNITGGELDTVLDGIDACFSAGYERLSLNAVLMKSSCDPGSVDRLVSFAAKKSIDLRFIELMPMAGCRELFQIEFIPYKEVLQGINAEGPTGRTGTAVIYRIPGSDSTVGFIPALSEPFCEECSRIRITADGKLKPCLHSAEEYDLLSYRTVRDLREHMREYIYNKPFSQRLSERGLSETNRPMRRIGG